MAESLNQRRNPDRLIGAVVAVMVASCALITPLHAQSSNDLQQLNNRLFEAVQKNDMATVRSVLTAGADPMAVDGAGQTPAGIAVERGFFDVAHYILAVRNQRQATRGAAPALDADAPPPSASTTREPPAPSWRDSTAPGKPAEIPPARLSQPARPVVVSPARPAPPTRRAATPQKGQPVAAAPTAEPAPPPLTNLPRVPAGTPNPFDPQTPEPTTPALASAPAANVPAANTPTSAGDPPPPQPSTGSFWRNPFSRLWNGVTDLFSTRGDDGPSSAMERSPESSSVGRPADAPTAEPKPKSENHSALPAPSPASETDAAKVAGDAVRQFFAQFRRAAPDDLGEPTRPTARGVSEARVSETTAPDQPAPGALEPAAPPLPAPIEVAAIADPVVAAPPSRDVGRIVSDALRAFFAQIQPAPSRDGDPGRVALPPTPVPAAPETVATVAPTPAAAVSAEAPPIDVVEVSEPPTAPAPARDTAKTVSDALRRFFAQIEPAPPREGDPGFIASPPTPAPIQTVATSAPQPVAPSATPSSEATTPIEVAKVSAPLSEPAPPRDTAKSVGDALRAFFARIEPAPPREGDPGFIASPPTPAPTQTVATSAPQPVAPSATPTSETTTPIEVAKVSAPLGEPAPPRDTAKTVSDALRTFFAQFKPALPEESEPAIAAPTSAPAPTVFETAATTSAPAAAPVDHAEVVEIGAEGQLPIIVDPTLTAAQPPPVAAPEPAAPLPPSPATKSDPLAGFFKKLFGTSAPSGSASEPSDRVRPKPQMPATVQLAGLTPLGAEPVRSNPKPSVAPPTLQGPLAVGETFSLSRTFADPEARAKSCFRKGRLPGWYCLVPVEWPDEIAVRMRVDSWLYGRGHVVAHFDNLGVAQSLFAPFPTDSFNHLIRYLEAELGPATNDASRRVALIGAPPKLNLMTSWARETDGVHAILEVRKLDTVRSMVPDTKTGFISLSRQGATPIFRYVSDSDLMMLSMRMESVEAQERMLGR